AALRVLVEGGYRVHMPRPADGARPLCCGRTFLSAGLVDEARAELDRLVTTYAPFAARGVPIVGLEPSCLLTLRDELLSLRSDEAAKSIGAQALLFEEFLAREAEGGRLRLPLGSVAAKALVHGHCHQKSFGAFTAVEKVLRLVPDLSVETIESSCCGMAGAFGYGADTCQTSMAMAELALLPAVRRADAATLIVADGTSCRHQIKDGTARSALHAARVLAMSLDRAKASPTLSPVAKEPTHG
ncbi:(Fe-S)-binding protein, partial [Bradyrhizobium sp.]|uniref:(Fe-S)-binding protein n=1 Tax=Bradyrhizobium sp. TaxID=376 RepID=UPI003C775806